MEIDSKNVVRSFFVQGNKPFPINEPGLFWVVKKCTVNIFAVSASNEESFRTHICMVRENEAFFGVKSSGNLSLIAIGTAGTELLEIKICDDNKYLAPYVERWVDILSQGVSMLRFAPRQLKLLDGKGQSVIEKGESFSVLDRVLWVRHMEGFSVFMGNEEASIRLSDLYFPLSRHVWLKGMEHSVIDSIDTEKQVLRDEELGSLQNFHDTVLNQLDYLIDISSIREAVSIERYIEHENKELNNALISLTLPIVDKKDIDYRVKLTDWALFDACNLIGKEMGVAFKEPSTSDKRAPAELLLSKISMESKIMTRKVALEHMWWKKDCGHLLGFINDSGAPVALISKPSGYRLIDPADKKEVPVDSVSSKILARDAYMFYKPFPNKQINFWDLLSFTSDSIRKDLRFFVLSAFATGFLGILMPVATAVIFNFVVPQKGISTLFGLAVALLTGIISTAIFQFIQGVTLLRIEGKTKGIIQAAIWDRLLFLPCSFFKHFSSGDLALRSLGFDSIMTQIFEGLAVPAILGAIYASFNLAVIFYYEKGLGFISAACFTVLFAVILLVTYLQLPILRKAAEVQGDISGFVFQIINGICKINVAGAHIRVFSKWAERFARQKNYSYQTGIISNALAVFNSLMPLAALAVIFAFIFIKEGQESINQQCFIKTGDFLAFNVAFFAFLMAMTQLGTAIIGLSNVIPLFDRMKPIFQTTKEVHSGTVTPGEISGSIEVSNISFRYRKDGPLVLKNLSFTVKPGEFVAFVGLSGSGKSTILRILLGFEEPEGGAVYYDGKNLSTLDHSALRYQIGAVMQKSELMAGEIYFNIIGSSSLSIDDAWEAARIAGIDDDIKAMPMGMHTYVIEGGQTFSGGQKQRILIARAVAKKPKIILFDEATSALDNMTQNIVTERLALLNATRIIVAQRLSTVIKADRIYVVEEGMIVQAGSYNELAETEGPFRRLVERQLAE